MTGEPEEFGWFWADVENGAGALGAMLPPPERPDPVPCVIVSPVFGRPALPRSTSFGVDEVVMLKRASQTVCTRRPLTTRHRHSSRPEHRPRASAPCD